MKSVHYKIKVEILNHLRTNYTENPFTIQSLLVTVTVMVSLPWLLVYSKMQNISYE